MSAHTIGYITGQLIVVLIIISIVMAYRKRQGDNKL